MTHTEEVLQDIRRNNKMCVAFSPLCQESPPSKVDHVREFRRSSPVISAMSCEAVVVKPMRLQLTTLSASGLQVRHGGKARQFTMRQQLFARQQVTILDPRTFPSLALCLPSSIGFWWTVPCVPRNELCCDTARVSFKDVEPRASQVQLQVKAGPGRARDSSFLRTYCVF